MTNLEIEPEPSRFVAQCLNQLCHRVPPQIPEVLISPLPDQEENRLGSMSGDTRNFNIQTRAVIKFFFLQGKAPKEIHVILTETLVCLLPGRAKDLSASL
jgi:hypothetical protein